MQKRDLIYRDDLLAAYDAAHKGPPGGARKLIQEAPAVDAVPVVTCRNCKHRPKDNTNARRFGGFDIKYPDEICPCQCDDGYYNWYPDDDWFCANGEAKDGGDNDEAD